MTIQRLVGQFLLPLLVLCLTGSLVGCNNSDPYNSGQQVGGPILSPSTVNPLDPTQPATQVGLFANRPVEGLGYSCEDSNETVDETDVTHDSSQSSSSGSLEGNAVIPVARCGNDAYSATFFLGKITQGNPTFSNHMDLGQVYLPVFSPKGTDVDQNGAAKSRFDVSNNDISSSTFQFNFSTADMENSPGRLNMANYPSDEQTREAVFKTALLMALDDGTVPGILHIPDAANEVMAYPANYGNVVIPSTFDYATYADFQAAWAPYLNAVQAQVPAIAGWPTDTSVVTAINEGVSRLGAGSFSVDYSNQIWPYYLSYLNCIFYELPQLSVNFMALPNGVVTGFGLANVNLAPQQPVSGGGCGNVSNAAVVGDFVFVGPPASSSADNSSLSSVQSLQNATVQAISNSSGSAAINLFGQFLGDFLYDGRVPPAVNSGGSTDFSVDYPKATSYVLQSDEQGSLTGNAFGITFPNYSDSSSTPGVTGVGTDPVWGANTPLPMPVRMSRSGRMQAVPLNAGLLSELPDYYLIRLMRACGPDEGICQSPTATPIPNATVEQGTGGNYPTQYCLQYQTDGNGNAIDDGNGNPLCETNELKSIVMETPLPNQLNGTDEDIYLYFDKTSQPGNVLVELADSSCTVQMDSGGKPYYLGFVTATLSGSGSLHDSVEVSLLFSASHAQGLASVPHLGVTVGGRIDLGQTSMPMYRLGNDNFSSQLRARWLDNYQYRLYQYVDYLNNPTSLTDGQNEKARGLGSGAVLGQALDGSCNLIP